jgi:hypothetical protein
MVDVEESTVAIGREKAPLMETPARISVDSMPGRPRGVHGREFWNVPPAECAFGADATSRISCATSLSSITAEMV